MADDSFERISERARELQVVGRDWSEAFSRSFMELLIEQWPAKWGDSLHFLVFGDFDPPEDVVKVPLLGVTVRPERRDNAFTRSALTTLGGEVTVREKSLAGVVDAVRRINLFLGVWTLVEWGNPALGWWCHITSMSQGGIVVKLEESKLGRPVESILRLPEGARRRVEAALYWIREPRTTIGEAHRPNLLRLYSAYWNAFECLVRAVCDLWPPDRLSRSDKQRLVNKFVADKEGRLTPGDIAECHRTIVAPGLVGKAAHALRECFPSEQADRYIRECFGCADRRQRLYDIRNSINHGEIDAENPEELMRIDSRFTHLQLIVLGMLGRLMRHSCPRNSMLIGDK